MTMDVMGLTKEDFVDGIEVGGAVTFLEYAKDASPTLNFLRNYIENSTGSEEFLTAKKSIKIYLWG